MNMTESSWHIENGKRVRVCVITGSHWSAVQGGAQYQAKCLVERMVGTGDFDVVYLARKFGGSARHDGYLTRAVGYRGLAGRYGFFVDAPSLLRALRDVRPHVIYQRGLQAYTGIAAYYCRDQRCRFLFHIAHDYDVMRLSDIHQSWRSLGKRIDRRIGVYGIHSAHTVVAQTERQAEMLRLNHGRECALTVPNFHPSPVTRVKQHGQQTRVAWVANFKPIKRPEVLVDLAEALSDRSDIQFVVIGRSGEDRLYKPLRKRIRRLRNVDYLGERSLDEVNSILETTDIFLNTSVAEGFPNTFIQAWMREVPVVSFSVDPDGVLARERIGLKVSGIAEARRQLCRLSDDRELRTEIGRRARHYALRQHGMQNADALIGLIRRMGLEAERNDGG